METVLVVGASGLTGAKLIGRIAASARVIGISRSAPVDLPPLAKWLPTDIGEPDVQAALPARIDAVYVLAQSPDFRRFPDQAENIFRVNVAATARLLDYARRAGARLFVYASSGGLYASSPAAITEDHPLRIGGPLGYYLATKRASELLVESYQSLITTVIVRPFFIYGPGQNITMLLPRLLASVREGRPIALAGRDGLMINPIHVDDAARLLAAALDARGHTLVNLAGSETASLRSIGEELGRIVGRPAMFEIDDSVPSPSMVADVTRLAKVLGTAEIGLARGLATLAA
jgi:UDP-glucose 4-epimerase